MRSLKTAIAVLAVLGLAGCHTATHVPPGQAKKVIDPPPGHEKKKQD